MVRSSPAAAGELGHEPFEQASPAYVETDAAGLILRFNPAADRLLRLSELPDRAGSLLAMLSPGDRAPVRDVLDQAAAAAPVAAGVAAHDPSPHCEAVARCPDGAQLPVTLTVRHSTVGPNGHVRLQWQVERRTLTGRAAAVLLRPVAAEFRPAYQVIAEAARDLACQHDPDATLEHMLEQARRAVPSCDQVGITLVRSKGRVETPAATGEPATTCDRLQCEIGEGPCLRAIDDSAPVRVPDAAHDARWPRFGPQAAQLGAVSILALPFPAGRSASGALNLYAARPDAFDIDDELVGQAFATHAGIALAHVEAEANLRIGLQTREEIGRAVGILMERHRVTAQTAFDMLVGVSQRTHRKLREIAAWINDTGQDPTELARLRR